MFGYVMANVPELPRQLQTRYQAVYCGICRRIREQSSNIARLGLSYDMAFLALLLMSLYEPEETGGNNACKLHPIRKRSWVDSEFIRYAADMNVALAYYKALDDYEDDRRMGAKTMAAALGKDLPAIHSRYPRQCEAIQKCIARLGKLEQENCPSADETAGCFGQLMAELFVLEEDMWSDTLREMGMALGRYIYLADAAVDYRRDLRKKRYNPYLAMGMGEDWQNWEQYLVLAMGRCTKYYEQLPLVQDKALLDNILYSGIWVEYRRKQRGAGYRREDANDQ